MFLQKFNSRETKKNLIEVTSNVIGGNILKIRGTYVHPKLIVNVASWCSVEYALKVFKHEGRKAQLWGLLYSTVS